jgi:hypothetical protein
MDRRAIASGRASVYGCVHRTVDELETYARAAARQTGLTIDEAWWPGVVRHLGVLLDRAALVAAVDVQAPEPGEDEPA